MSLERALAHTARACTAFGAVALAVMMFATNYDVAARALFRAPLYGAVDIVEMMVLCSAFLIYLLGPAWGWGLAASMLAGFGYYLLHATLQTHATQMVPNARGTAVAWFASCLFLGQAVGVALAGLVVDAAGAAALFGVAAVLLPLLGGSFAWALRRRPAAH